MSSNHKQETDSRHDTDARIVDLDPLLLHLFRLAEELLGETQAVFDRFSQAVEFGTQGRVQLVLHRQNGARDASSNSPHRLHVQYKDRFYGMLYIASDPEHPGSPVIPSVAASLLAQMCGWLFYNLELAALMPELEESHTHAHLAGASLTKRELEVVRLMCQGYEQEEIVDMLHITKATVRKHREHIYGKLDVHSERATWFEAFSTGLYYPLDDLRPHILSIPTRQEPK